MGLAQKLRDVVAANFIEIARVDTPPEKPVEPVYTPQNTSADLATYAESELDSFLKDVHGSPKAEEPELTTEPVVVPEPEPLVTGPVLVSLTDAVSEEGDLDFGRVFQQYDLPTVSFSAEQAMSMLQSLPRDLALRTKRATVNTTLSAIGQVVGATPQDIVQDASRKKETLERYVGALGHEIEETTATMQAEIDRLQAEIAAHNETLRSLTKKRAAATELCQSRMNMLDQVINFFDYDEAKLNETELETQVVPTDPDEMPAFMRDDAVRRMLGINDDFLDENGEFDPMKFAQAQEKEPAAESTDAEGKPRRPRAKS